jgi:hypothetical protein
LVGEIWALACSVWVDSYRGLRRAQAVEQWGHRGGEGLSVRLRVVGAGQEHAALESGAEENVSERFDGDAVDGAGVHCVDQDSLEKPEPKAVVECAEAAPAEHGRGVGKGYLTK